jgi:hypothetical protein
MTGKEVSKVVLNIDDLMTASEWNSKTAKRRQGVIDWIFTVVIRKKAPILKM